MAETRKVLFQRRPAAATLEDGYTVAAATQVVGSTIVVCNTGAATSFRISVAIAGAADALGQYLFYDATIAATATTTITIGFTLGATDKIRVYATLATLSFTGFGVELT